VRGVQKWTDQHVEELVGNLLQIGVTVASAVVLTGGIVYLKRHGLAAPEYHAFVGAPSDLRSFSGILGETLAFHGRGIIQFGILLLIATPIVRVAFAATAFGFQRDRLYVVVALIVLTVLIFSFVSGQG